MRRETSVDLCPALSFALLSVLSFVRSSLWSRLFSRHAHAARPRRLGARDRRGRAAGGGRPIRISRARRRRNRSRRRTSRRRRTSCCSHHQRASPCLWSRSPPSGLQLLGPVFRRRALQGAASEEPAARGEFFQGFRRKNKEEKQTSDQKARGEKKNRSALARSLSLTSITKFYTLSTNSRARSSCAARSPTRNARAGSCSSSSSSS